VAHTHWRSSIVREGTVIVLAAIAIIATIGGFILISNYVMPKYPSILPNEVGCVTLL